MKDGELKVFYENHVVNSELDKALEATMLEFGYKQWASGYNLIDGVRDLAFDKQITKAPLDETVNRR